MMTSIIRKITKMLSVLLIIQIIFAIVNISEASWVDSAKDFLNLGKNTASSGKIISNQSDNASVQINLPTDSTLKGLINDMPIDMIELDIKNIWEMLGTINGTTYEEELLDEMFSRFCLGK